MRLSTIFSDSNKVGLRRALLVCAAAAALALAPQGALAQHGGASGGGGHASGGGSHSSGGFSGGHSSGSWSGGVNEGSTGSATRGSTSARGGSASNGGGHWWSGIFGGGHGTAENGPAKTGTTRTGTTGNSTARTDNFAMHNTWVNPPARGSAATRVGSMDRNDSFAFLRTPAANSRSAVRLGHWGPRYQPTYYYVPPFYYGYGGFDGCGFYWYGPCSGLGFGWGSGYGYGFGLGFGWAGPYGSGWATGCDPMWGCGYGYSNYDMSGTAGAAPGGDYTIDAGGQSDSGSGASADAQENSPSSYDAGPASAEAGNSANTNAAAAAAAANAQPFVLFMKDGSSYAVTDYWLAGGKLHYVTTYRGENTVDLSRLDVQKTVDRNAANGMKFELRSAPVSTQTGATATAAPGETTAPAEPQAMPQQ